MVGLLDLALVSLFFPHLHYIYIYMCVCMYVWMYVCMYVCMRCRANAFSPPIYLYTIYMNSHFSISFFSDDYASPFPPFHFFASISAHCFHFPHHPYEGVATLTGRCPGMFKENQDAFFVYEHTEKKDLVAGVLDGHGIHGRQARLY